MPIFSVSSLQCNANCLISSDMLHENAQEAYGKHQALKWWVYWRLFYLACSELFNYSKGQEWGVGHYLFMKK